MHDIAHLREASDHPSICRVSRKQETDLRPSRMARVIRIPCHDDDTSFVLVHINRSAGGSSNPLDLTLVGTEGTAPYVLTCKPHLKVGLPWPPRAEIHALTQNSATVKQSKVFPLKAKNGPCTHEEWTLILESVLLGKQASDDRVELLDGVETIASVQEKKSIDITIRKRTEEITVSFCHCSIWLMLTLTPSNGLVLSTYLMMETKRLSYSSGVV